MMLVRSDVGYNISCSEAEILEEQCVPAPLNPRCSDPLHLVLRELPYSWRSWHR